MQRKIWGGDTLQCAMHCSCCKDEVDHSKALLGGQIEMRGLSDWQWWKTTKVQNESELLNWKTKTMGYFKTIVYNRIKI